jgi:hypothetical protein
MFRRKGVLMDGCNKKDKRDVVYSSFRESTDGLLGHGRFVDVSGRMTMHDRAKS